MKVKWLIVSEPVNERISNTVPLFSARLRPVMLVLDAVSVPLIANRGVFVRPTETEQSIAISVRLRELLESTVKSDRPDSIVREMLKVRLIKVTVMPLILNQTDEPTWKITVLELSVACSGCRIRSCVVREIL